MIRKIKDVRDAFNRGVNPIIDTIESPYNSSLLKVRDVMNRDINAIIRDIENPFQPHPGTTIRTNRFGLWLYLWYLRRAWKDLPTAKRELYDTLCMVKDCHFSLVEGFTFVDDGDPVEHGHLNGKTPWRLYDGKFHLGEFNPKYWNIAKEALKIFKVLEIDFQPTLVMRNYTERPFINNVNGVSKLKSYEAIPFILALGFKWVELFKEVYGNSYKPFLKIANEFSHSSAEEFKFNGIFHDKIIRPIMNSGIPRGNFNVDVSFSEGCSIYLNEPQYHPKIDETLGDPEADRSNPVKSILSESHNNCIKANLVDTEKLMYLGSKWVRYCFSGDGGAYPFHAQAKGIHIPGTDFVYADKEQYREYFRYLFTENKKRGKTAYTSHVTFECFKKDNQWNLWVENCHVDNIDWELAAIPAEIHKEVYG